jgi:D-alanyl-D-alanine carboxypeptidase (penicillin-binding protein 5/6)
VQYDGPIKAPIAQGQRVATLVVTAPDFPGMRVPLYAARGIGEMGLFGRMMLGLHLLISGKSGS